MSRGRKKTGLEFISSFFEENEKGLKRERKKGGGIGKTLSL